MTNSFLEAKREWDKLHSEFLKKNSKTQKKKVADRVEILLTVPKGMEQEFKDLAKLRREQADAAHKAQGSDSISLSLEFERDNPPPKRSDYE